MLLLVYILPAVLLETALGLWRRRRGRSQGYVLLSALLRTVAYSPCLVPVAMTVVLPVPLSVFLVAHAAELLLGYAEESRAILLFGIPEVIVFAIAYRRAEHHRRRGLVAPPDRVP